MGSNDYNNNNKKQKGNLLQLPVRAVGWRGCCLFVAWVGGVFRGGCLEGRVCSRVMAESYSAYTKDGTYLPSRHEMHLTVRSNACMPAASKRER